MRLSDIVIVLSRPAESGNIGAVCRAMKNMGLFRLRLVAPEINDTAALLARAVHAGNVWKSAQTFDTLADAVADCAIVVGTSRRRGHKRKTITMNPHELAGYLAGREGNAALVFGNERTGLETAELARCNLASHIDADSGFPSLNLSHAVQIYCYELRAALNTAETPAGHWAPIGRAATDALVTSISSSLAKIGFYCYRGREEQEIFFRDLINRAGLTVNEARYLGNIFAKASKLAENFPLSTS
ncbi:MAG: RNA methyltransferase [Spirochaetaceae bacterium]|jgi:tRNA/rRNA methyltransferase/tRNA (cytidine32/uridine32-2'-O)-methyltransferase|nr:RNA methyltransferase [Spirochaetaceae bacterium]